ncbi:MAG: GH32 C-terminal domain-containing protein [Phycisphaerae bacterium]|jgi:sucrose-6-phosphate hydrolase SacC (GH32 family)|nr:GH32 C-terminal domain-containing protein [Phycisphaerae bacterium]MDP7289810.1 GH32 C-terminal domain-containing protein [Phycisphaerae bacterium]|tara:strand:+ start:229 stop:510 length:282 start_codon:yes stop_codon:yes gene_type:complete
MQLGTTWVVYDVPNKAFTHFGLKSYDKEDDKLDLRIFIDTATIEVFGEHGAVFYLDNRHDQGVALDKILLRLKAGSATIESMKIYKLRSIRTK